MQILNIEIKKDDVMEEVAKTTAFIGSKKTLEDGKSAYEQVFVKESDKVMLEQYWKNAIGGLCQVWLKWVKEWADTEGDKKYVLTLVMPDMYNSANNDAVKKAAFNYMVNWIIAEWCGVANKDEVKMYQEKTVALGGEIKKLLYSRKRPIRNF